MKSVSGKAMCKALERAGWQFQRINGSHHIYTKPGHPKTISVPVHGNKPLKIGTQKNIMKDAVLTEDDL